MVRNTSATREVLSVFLGAGGTEVYGLDVIRETGLASGTIYPILRRLEDNGWLTSRWEDVDPQVEGRPARRLYLITGEGVRAGHAFAYQVDQRKRRHGQGWQRPLPGTEAGL